MLCRMLCVFDYPAGSLKNSTVVLARSLHTISTFGHLQNWLSDDESSCYILIAIEIVSNPQTTVQYWNR